VADVPPEENRLSNIIIKIFSGVCAVAITFAIAETISRGMLGDALTTAAQILVAQKHARTGS
jgi:hypothetical protein